MTAARVAELEAKVAAITKERDEARADFAAVVSELECEPTREDAVAEILRRERLYDEARDALNNIDFWLDERGTGYARRPREHEEPNRVAEAVKALFEDYLHCRASEARMREALSETRNAMYEVIGQQHVLKYALDFIAKWGDDPTFTDAEQRKREVARATDAVTEWHRLLVVAGQLGQAALSTPASDWLAARDRRVAEMQRADDIANLTKFREGFEEGMETGYMTMPKHAARDMLLTLEGLFETEPLVTFKPEGET